MFENCSSWPPVEVSRFRPFLSYIENPWALGPISKCEGPRWAHSPFHGKVLGAIMDFIYSNILKSKLALKLFLMTLFSLYIVP